jgi:uncharacterized protein YozE (UPF0346 family)
MYDKNDFEPDAAMIRTLKRLGKPYTTKVIDGTPCIYRDLGGGFDIEVCGVKPGGGCLFMTVWDLRCGTRTVESIYDVQNFQELHACLEYLVAKYTPKEGQTLENTPYREGRNTMSFYDWCMGKHLGRNTPAGDLAADMKHDVGFPRTATDKSVLESYLHSKHACKEAMRTFNVAYRAFDRMRQHP